MAINNGRVGGQPVLTNFWPVATNTTATKSKATPLPDQPVVTKAWPPYTADTTAVTQNTAPFSNADVYRLQSQGYADQGNTAMANAFGGLANDLGAYSNFANTTIGSADALLNYIRQNETGLQNVAGNLYNQLTGDIQNQRDYINTMFGPNGELTNEVNKYYDDLGNYLATDAGRQAALIAAQGMHSGASLGAIRAQQNEAYNESFGRYIQAKEQQINAKQQIASNLINYMSTLRQEYGDTTNQYIIELYKRANDLYNSVAQSIAGDIDQYNKLRLSSGGGGATTTISKPTIENINGVNYWVTRDGNGNIINKTVVMRTTNDTPNLGGGTTEGSGVYGPRVDQWYTLGKSGTGNYFTNTYDNNG